MLTQEFAGQFAREWIEASNAHDLDRLFAHYSDDFEMTSPYIIAVMNNPSGTIQGKANVRRYFEAGYARLPDLRFELQRVTFSVNSIAIYFKNVTRNRRVIEWFLFNDDGLCCKSIAHYDQLQGKKIVKPTTHIIRKNLGRPRRFASRRRACDFIY